MKDNFFIHSNKILLYLIPLFFITNQKYSTCENNLIFQDYPSVEEEIDKICQQNKNLCIMVDAIKCTFNESKTYSQQYEQSIDYSRLKYQSVKSINIYCQNISGEIQNIEDGNKNEDTKYIINLSNCTSIMEGKLTYISNSEEKYLTEILLDKITIILNKNNVKGVMSVLFEYSDKNFSYDKSHIIFDEPQVANKMDILMDLVFKNYTYNLKNIIELNNYQLLSQIGYFSEIINKFAKEYSYIAQKIENNEKKITYIAYNEFKYDSLININNHIYIPNLRIFFEYTLSYNITYNEGNLELDYMNISKSKNYDVYIGNIINKSAEISEILSNEEAEQFWKDIKSDLFNKFRDYK